MSSKPIRQCPKPLNPDTPPPIDRYCDIVLKGGVTDGVIYPWAIMELAAHYRFKNIGGTSVGALAAAVTAASEYSRRYGSVHGFNKVMLEIPFALAKENENGDTKIFSLFQPTNACTKRLFDVFVAFFGSGKNKKKSVPTQTPPQSQSQFIEKYLKRVFDQIFTAFHLPSKKLLGEKLPSGMDALFKAYQRWIYYGFACGIAIGVFLGIFASIHNDSRGQIAFSQSTLVHPLIMSILCFGGIFSLGMLQKTLKKNPMSWCLYSIFLSLVIAEAIFSFKSLKPIFGTWLLDGIEYLALIVFAAIFSAIVFVGYRLLLDIVHGLVPDGFGLCTGMKGIVDTPNSNNSDGLIDWLHKGIQGAAGLPLDQVLTFRDLWDAPCGPTPNYVPTNNIGYTYRSIDLRMVTTNISHGRPYGLPLSETSDELFFLEDELKLFFPKSIIQHLVNHSPEKIVGKSGKSFHRLPSADMPIVVATRLSLSFPILFKAVPLWARTPKRALNNIFHRCWFSDGGICSNFPIHQFDAAVPRWPTFGIMLGNTSGPNDDAVWIAKNNSAEPEEGLANKKTAQKNANSPLSRLIKFGVDIVYTAKDWNDNSSARLPGVRDRIVHVKLPNGEIDSNGKKKLDLGGLNLRLTHDEILLMADEYGRVAGQKLVEKFLIPKGARNYPSSQIPISKAWQEHRWVRFNTFVSALRVKMSGITYAAQHAEYSERLTDQIAALVDPNTFSDPFNLTETQALALTNALDALIALEDSFKANNVVQSYQPHPHSALQLRTPL